MTTERWSHRRHPADEPERAIGRYASLEGYRGLAALLIVVYHVYQYMRTGPPTRYPLEGTLWHTVLIGLDSFVGLFFVLSAFLLGLAYARAALAGTRPMSARTFLYRRAVRIVPLYLVAVLIVWAARNRSLPGDWVDLLEHLTFTQVFDDKRIFYTIGPAWSLAVEVHFYLLLVLLGAAACAMCRRIRDRRRRLRALLLAVGTLGVLGMVWKVVAHYVLRIGEERWSIWFSLPASLDLFAVGLLLAVVVAARGEQPFVARPVRAALIGLGTLVIVVAFAMRDPSPVPHLYFHTATAIGFGLLLAASALAPPRAGGGILASTIPALLGLISYSLYLWHEPVMLFLAGHHLFPTPGTPYSFPLGVLVLVCTSIVVAWLSYWIIEYPTGMLRRSRGHQGELREYYKRRPTLTRMTSYRRGRNRE
jgi:peptidoglycan/LPS O-acetylase OafA/YrhL